MGARSRSNQHCGTTAGSGPGPAFSPDDHIVAQLRLDQPLEPLESLAQFADELLKLSQEHIGTARRRQVIERGSRHPYTRHSGIATGLRVECRRCASEACNTGDAAQLGETGRAGPARSGCG